MGRGASVRIVTNLRNRLADYLEPIDQDKRMAVDFSVRRAVVTPRVAMAACIVIAVLALGAIAAVVWPSSQVEMPAVQDAAEAGTTPETTETSAETPGGPGKETNAQAQAGPLIVSVVGLVVNPGVVEVPAGARVVEAIERAGGLLPEANPASVNLAAALVDGQQIVVGTEALPAETAEGGPMLLAVLEVLAVNPVCLVLAVLPVRAERSTSTPPPPLSWRNCPESAPQRRPKSSTFGKRTGLLRVSTHLRRFRESARRR